MVDRIKLLLQKRTAFKSQMTIVNNILEKDEIDKISIDLRIKRLSELYSALEEASDELMVLDPNENHVKDFHTIQERYYNIMSRVRKLLNTNQNAGTSTTTLSEESCRSSTASDENNSQNPKLKLPKISLQNFDGKYENWLSFKNMFLNVIDSRSDLTELDKFHYLKSVVVGEASKKLDVFSVHPNNYKKAWELLVRSYEVKRVLVSQHISMIFDLPTLNKGTSNGFSKLADDMQQNIASLNELGVVFSPEIAIYIIETRLPKNTLKEWESTLNRDEMPSLDKLYEFLYKSAVCASRQERIRPAESESAVNPTPCKKKRQNNANKAFLLNSTHKCSVCQKESHPLFKCEVFKQLSVPKRIDAVKAAKVCFNCLRSHRGKQCRSSGCVICQRRHNTLIHFSDKTLETKNENITKIAETEPNTA
ncbi:uncharacterized protein [Prorops nasuta]|uniref:uncharacterized protein n=1 Tax=Prorops nasuta TaxID=863751 RepID=UPI0034CDCB42